jgi:hypothetical protein
MRERDGPSSTVPIAKDKVIASPTRLPTRNESRERALAVYN